MDNSFKPNSTKYIAINKMYIDMFSTPRCHGDYS